MGSGSSRSSRAPRPGGREKEGEGEEENPSLNDAGKLVQLMQRADGAVALASQTRSLQSQASEMPRVPRPAVFGTAASAGRMRGLPGPERVGADGAVVPVAAGGMQAARHARGTAPYLVTDVARIAEQQSAAVTARRVLTHWAGVHCASADARATERGAVALGVAARRPLRAPRRYGAQVELKRTLARSRRLPSERDLQRTSAIAARVDARRGAYDDEQYGHTWSGHGGAMMMMMLRGGDSDDHRGGTSVSAVSSPARSSSSAAAARELLPQRGFPHAAAAAASAKARVRGLPRGRRPVGRGGGGGKVGGGRFSMLRLALEREAAEECEAWAMGRSPAQALDHEGELLLPPGLLPPPPPPPPRLSHDGHTHRPLLPGEEHGMHQRDHGGDHDGVWPPPAPAGGVGFAGEAVRDVDDAAVGAAASGANGAAAAAAAAVMIPASEQELGADARAWLAEQGLEGLSAVFGALGTSVEDFAELQRDDFGPLGVHLGAAAAAAAAADMMTDS
jgi:hypothetical protein